MNRRETLLALSGALTTTALLAAPRHAAFAQTPGVPLASTSCRQGTLIGGTFSLQTSQVALQRAQHPRVKQFAEFETNEQMSIAQVLTDTDNPPLAPLDPQRAAALASLQTRTGSDFDQTYIAAQLVSHRELLQLQQNYLSFPVTNRDLEHIAVLARTSITMHLTLLQEIQAALPA